MPDNQIPLLATSEEQASALVPFAQMPVSLQIFFNPLLFERCKEVARYLSKAEGFAPRHLINKPEACFAIVSRSLTWKLDPYAVAQATYQTPNGQIGYYGSLCQAIIENSGRLVGGVNFRHFGDWNKIQRHFKFARSEKGRDYAVPAWDEEDEEGVGVIVSAQIKDEIEPRELEFFLTQAWPRNSTLWATDPMTQIKYTAVRRFATSVAPTQFMGVPFDREDVDNWTESLKDVTPPRPRREDFGLRETSSSAAVDEEKTSEDLPTHIMMREEREDEADGAPETHEESEPAPPTSEQKGETPELADDTGAAGATAAPPARDAFWNKEKFAVAKVMRGDRVDWPQTQMALLYWIEEAETSAEIRKLQADSRATLDGLKLADKARWEAVIDRAHQRITALGEIDAGGNRISVAGMG